MTIFLVIVHVIVCFTLILVILLQAGRGQGLTTSSLGSGNVQSLFGTRAADFLTKATTVAAIGFLLTSISLDLLEVRKSKSLFQVKQQAPMDIEQIKKALEKVKAESENAAGQAQEAVQEAGQAVEAAATDAAAEIPAGEPAENKQAS